MTHFQLVLLSAKVGSLISQSICLGLTCRDLLERLHAIVSTVMKDVKFDIRYGDHY